MTKNSLSRVLNKGPTRSLVELAMSHSGNSENTRAPRRNPCTNRFRNIEADAAILRVVCILIGIVLKEAEHAEVIRSIAAIGNTTTPASHLTMTNLDHGGINVILQQSGNALPSFQMWPLPLLSEMIRINHLRKLAARPKPTTSTKGDLRLDAYRILGRIHDFSPKQWADIKQSSKED